MIRVVAQVSPSAGLLPGKSCMAIMTTLAQAMKRSDGPPDQARRFAHFARETGLFYHTRGAKEAPNLTP